LKSIVAEYFVCVSALSGVTSGHGGRENVAQLAVYCHLERFGNYWHCPFARVTSFCFEQQKTI